MSKKTIDKIKVIDDFLPEDLFKRILLISLKLPWHYGWNTKEDPLNLYWHHEVGFGNKSNKDDISKNVIKHPIKEFSEIQSFLKKNLMSESGKILRFYLNAHTYGTDGSPHTDSDSSEELTAVLYLTSDWKINFSGETVIFDELGEIIKSILPKKNRLLLFPSNLKHQPRPLSKVYRGLRVVLVIKFSP